MKSSYRPYLLTVEELLENKMFNIPVYQRPYSWNHEQVSVLLDDLYEYFRNDEELFVGTLYAKNIGTKIGQIVEYELIDGQQRIVTISFILMVLYSMLLKNGSDSTEREIYKIKNILWKYANRENQRSLHLITSKSLEKDTLINLFESAFDSIQNFDEYINTYEMITSVDKNIKDVITLIFKFFNNKELDAEKLLDYSDFLLGKVNLIMIESNVSNSIIFSMFEAINSKGKKLDDIDLIKTYIFSKLDENDYDQYLKKWGFLIAETNDKLEDYLWVYVKAFIKYYIYSIKVKYFKSMLNDSKAISFFETDNEKELIKKLIDDLVNKVKYYKALDRIEEFKKITENKKHIFQYNIYKNMKYEHPKPLFLKALYEFDISSKNTAEKENLEKIFKYINSYMMIYQTMNKRDSKDSIPVIQNILEHFYDLEKLSSEYIKEVVSNKLLNENLHLDSFIKRFYEIEGYKGSATDIGFVMLVIHNSYNEESDFFSEDQANSWFEIKNQLSLDHLLVRNPNPNSNFQYYKTTTVIGDEILKLKEKSDFPEDIIENMPYEDFTTKILNKIGNLRLEFKDSNSSRGNLALTLKDDEEFLTYNQVQSRAKKVLNNIIKSNAIFIPNKDDLVVKTEDDYFILDVEDINEVRGKKPEVVTIFDKTYTVNSNKELVKVVLGFLYRENPELMNSLLNGYNGYGTEIKPWLTTDKSKLRTAEKIDKSNIYFEANRDAVSQVKFIVEVFTEIFGYNIENLEIIYKK